MRECLILILAGTVAPGFVLAEPVSFNRDIRPILSNNCYACHGFDQNERKAKLRLDTREGATAKAIVPGDPEGSPLWQRVSQIDDDEVMPPAESGKSLTLAQRSLLKQWISEGAPWEDHWAYIAPKRLANRSIDDFVSATLQSEGLTMSAKADRRTLARRLAFDITGLPPVPEQVTHFVNNDGSDAFARYVEDLLASPRYGERMAIYWLDLVRFADTCGYHGDQHRDVALYRDYVIDAFNENLSFDQFTVEQLAGDLLENPTSEQRIASGYNRLLQTTEEGGSQPKEYIAKYAADRVRNVSTVWMGSTLGCAECHDHKFDPFTQKDFYSLAAFFADIEEVAVGRNGANMSLPTDEQAEALAAVDAKIAPMKQQIKGASDDEKKGLQADLNKLQAKRKRIDAEIAKTMVVKVRKEPLMTRVLPRGNWLDETGEVVQPSIPAHLGELTVDGNRRANRLDLAKWMIDSDNPLTARVFVNRVWKLFFGQAIARTLEDVGAQGEWPTHPELLDWLALEFVESGWDVKQLIRMIVHSEAYQQSSMESESMRERDPYNRLLARQGRFRLEAEMVRDNALAVSGLMVHREGGRSAKPYQPEGYWGQLNFPKRTYQPDQDQNQYRRGVYTYWCRTFLHPSMAAFDAPTREECTAERVRSNTPLQALVLLNDPTYVEAARALAQKLDGLSPREGIARAFGIVLSRKPSSHEVGILYQLHADQVARFSEDPAAAKALLEVGLAQAPETTPELAAWTSVSRAILNLHETITRY